MSEMNNVVEGKAGLRYFQVEGRGTKDKEDARHLDGG